MKNLLEYGSRLLIFAALAAIVSACSGDQTVAPPLLNEPFNGTFPGSTWTSPATTGSGGTVQIISTGNPQPGLEFSGVAATGSVSTTTTSAFSNPGVTFSVQESASSTPPGLVGTSTISIVDSTPTVVATAVWDAGAATVVFMITGTTTSSSALAVDGAFHTFKFSVDSSGNASWILDGGTKQTKGSFPAGNLNLRLGATFGTGSAWPTFLFDNVIVTAP